MSRFCNCHRRCHHFVPSGSEGLLAPARLLELGLVMGALVDAADAFDTDGLVVDRDCEVHGTRAVSNGSCICVGERVSAVEFVQALILDVRVAQHNAIDTRPDHRENRRAGQYDRRALETVSAG